MATAEEIEGQEVKREFQLVSVKLFTDLDTDLDPNLQKQLLPSPVEQKPLNPEVLKSGWISPALRPKPHAEKPDKASAEAHAEKPDKASVEPEDKSWNEPLDVIALLKDNKVPENLRLSRRIGKAGDLVTGSVLKKNIVGVRKEVKSLKAVLPLQLELLVSLPAVRCSRGDFDAAFPGRKSSFDGTRVIVGIVDRGCDFAHPNFRRTTGETRLLYLWDQRGGLQPNSPIYGYGQEIDATRINHALEQPDPYGAVGYDLESAAHGTHVMDIAAGNGNGTGVCGVAPNADLIFVDLATGEEEQHGTIGNSRHLLEAVDYIFAKAKALNRPAVVNLSLGMHSGPHDGSTLVEQGFERLLNDEKDRAIAVAAGNAGGEPIHVGGTIAGDGVASVINWTIAATAGPGQNCEIWYSGAPSEKGKSVELTLKSPYGQDLGTSIPPGRTFLLVGKNEKNQDVPVGYVIHRAEDPNNDDNHIDLQLPPSDPSVAKEQKPWEITLTNRRSHEIRYDAWIQRDDFGASKLSDQDGNTMLDGQTLGSICCGRSTLTVGAFDAHLPQLTLFSGSGAGPVRKVAPGEHRPKPEVFAPGVGVVAASSRSSSLLRLSGTSVAVPHVTGLIALLFEAAGRPLSVQEVRAAITSAAHATGKIDGVTTLKCIPLADDQEGSPPEPSPPNEASEGGSPNGNGKYVTTGSIVAALQQMINSLNPPA